MCGLLNDVPTDYFCPLNDVGLRTDYSSRPELMNGVIEVIAPAEYMVRPPQPPVYLFVIDATLYSVNGGQLQVGYLLTQFRVFIKFYFI